MNDNLRFLLIILNLRRRYGHQFSKHEQEYLSGYFELRKYVELVAKPEMEEWDDADYDNLAITIKVNLFREVTEQLHKLETDMNEYFNYDHEELLGIE